MIFLQRDGLDAFCGWQILTPYMCERIFLSLILCKRFPGKCFHHGLPSGMGHTRVPSIADGETFLLNMIPAQNHAVIFFSLHKL